VYFLPLSPLAKSSGLYLDQRSLNGHGKYQKRAGTWRLFIFPAALHETIVVNRSTQCRVFAPIGSRRKRDYHSVLIESYKRQSFVLNQKVAVCEIACVQAL
jgi:hypothetical protein